MRVEDFRDPNLAEKLFLQIKKESSDLKDINIMEVCGTHTMAIARYGIKKILPPNIHLLSGPGCPVCVTSQGDIDKIISLAGIPDVIIVTFGDMVRVPGTESSLEKEKAKGAIVTIAYSPFEAILLAEKNSEKKIIFVGVGFETTSPSVGVTVKEAEKRNLKNFFVYSAFKIIPPALRTILSFKERRIDGFILPGHVSTIIGSKPYEFIKDEYKVPSVIAGFEPLDILLAILNLINQIKNGEPLVEIEYKRSVKPEGNVQAKKVLKDVYVETNSNWRGIGEIPLSGLKLNEKYERFEAEKKFPIQIATKDYSMIKGCICGEILLGLKVPADCKFFGKGCAPENPVGPCMVSSEGACSAWYKYGLKKL